MIEGCCAQMGSLRSFPVRRHDTMALFQDCGRMAMHIALE